jgi:electron transfer flavoprotein beta subunit
LRVVVCTKEVPDTAAKVEVKDGKVTWGDAPLVINPWDEYSVEEAILLKEQRGADAVTVIGMGGDATKEALKHALAMGVDDAVLISDAAFAAADTLVTSEALAKAIAKLGDVGVAVFGKETSDGNSSQVATQVGRRLGWPTLTYVSKIISIDWAGCKITVERLLDGGKQTAEASLPAVISVVKEVNEPRYPSFMGIRKASKAEIPTWGAADINFNSAVKSKVTWPEVYALPPREGSVQIMEGATPEEAAKKLVDKLIAEKVI